MDLTKIAKSVASMHDWELRYAYLYKTDTYEGIQVGNNGFIYAATTTILSRTTFKEKPDVGGFDNTGPLIKACV